jgi:AraC-like DNA-binding protein
MVRDFSLDAIFNIILITGVIYGFIFNAVLFFSKRRKGKALLYLNLLVFFISLNNLQAWLIAMNITSSNIYISYSRIPWYFLVVPMFYIFLIYYLKIQHKIRTFLYLTSGIFIGFLIVRIFLIYYTQSADLNPDDVNLLMNKYSKFEEIVSFVYGLIILIKLISIFTRNKKILEYVMNYDDLKWITHFLYFAGLCLFIWVTAIIQNYEVDEYSSTPIYYALRLSTSILIYWIGFKGLFRYRILEDRITLRENINNEILSKKGSKDLRVAIDSDNHFPAEKSDRQFKLFQKISAYIVEQKKYLDPYLGLDSLAEALNVSSGHLSFLINTYSDHNFSDFINELRIEQAKKLIMEEEYIDYTIVSIGLESGFNSKSTFYAAFKKFTNLSPTQFKKEFAA